MRIILNINIYLLLILTLITHNIFSANAVHEIITNHSRTDGFGSQFQEIITCVIYAELNNKKYVYTPFKGMEHNYNLETDFISKKEHLINFIDNFEINSDLSAKVEVEYKEFFDENVIKCANSLSLKKIKNIFRANKNINNYFNNERLNIAIHIRRPNPHDNRQNGTNTPDDIFFKIINRLRVIYFPKNPLFHIYSQGNIENFQIFNAHDTVFHINESIENTFTSMVLADILVIGTSSFSYTAGLLSEGTVYYHPFWHAPLPGWISVDELLKK